LRRSKNPPRPFTAGLYGWDIAFDGARRILVGSDAFTSSAYVGNVVGDRAPWLLETRLRERGAHFEAGPAWTPHIVVDGDLITGQNHASSQAAADRALAELHVGQT
jgi:putative intracellular protease/amidase